MPRSAGRGSRVSTEERAARAAIVNTAKAMSRRGLSPGRSGNVSCRTPGGMLITPSGLPYDDMMPEDVVPVAADGSVASGRRSPSSEWQLHRAVYAARPDRAAIVHTHSLHAVVLACAGRSIPAFHYMVAVAGGRDIPCVPYATFGTEELARNVATGLQHRDACLMAHHGQVAIARDLDAALELAAEVEVLAEQYVKVLLLGTTKLLDDEEMARVARRFAGYGRAAAVRNPDSTG